MPMSALDGHVTPQGARGTAPWVRARDQGRRARGARGGGRDHEAGIDLRPDSKPSPVAAEVRARLSQLGRSIILGTRVAEFDGLFEGSIMSAAGRSQVGIHQRTQSSRRVCMAS